MQAVYQPRVSSHFVRLALGYELVAPLGRHRTLLLRGGVVVFSLTVTRDNNNGVSSLLHGVLTPHGSCTLFSVLCTLKSSTLPLPYPHKKGFRNDELQKPLSMLGITCFPS